MSLTRKRKQPIKKKLVPLWKRNVSRDMLKEVIFKKLTGYNISGATLAVFKQIFKKVVWFTKQTKWPAKDFQEFRVRFKNNPSYRYRWLKKYRYHQRACIKRWHRVRGVSKLVNNLKSGMWPRYFKCQQGPKTSWGLSRSSGPFLNMAPLPGVFLSLLYKQQYFKLKRQHFIVGWSKLSRPRRELTKKQMRVIKIRAGHYLPYFQTSCAAVLQQDMREDAAHYSRVRRGLQAWLPGPAHKSGYAVKRFGVETFPAVITKKRSNSILANRLQPGSVKTITTPFIINTFASMYGRREPVYNVQRLLQTPLFQQYYFVDKQRTQHGKWRKYSMPGFKPKKRWTAAAVKSRVSRRLGSKIQRYELKVAPWRPKKFRVEFTKWDRWQRTVNANPLLFANVKMRQGFTGRYPSWSSWLRYYSRFFLQTKSRLQPLPSLNLSTKFLAAQFLPKTVLKYGFVFETFRPELQYKYRISPKSFNFKRYQTAGKAQQLLFYTKYMEQLQEDSPFLTEASVVTRNTKKRKKKQFVFSTTRKTPKVLPKLLKPYRRKQHVDSLLDHAARITLAKRLPKIKRKWPRTLRRRAWASALKFYRRTLRSFFKKKFVPRMYRDNPDKSRLRLLSDYLFVSGQLTPWEVTRDARQNAWFSMDHHDRVFLRKTRSIFKLRVLFRQLFRWIYGLTNLKYFWGRLAHKLQLSNYYLPTFLIYKQNLKLVFKNF